MTDYGAPRAFIDALKPKGRGCLTWPYSTDRHGRPQMRGVSNLNRFVCEKFNGPPPTPEHQAAHSCGKGHEACIAPWHFVWKTRKENELDKSIHGTRHRGEKVNGAKLNAKLVREIRSFHWVLPYQEIAKRYGIAPTTVANICKRRTWKHV